MSKRDRTLKVLNEFEVYIGAAIFIAMMLLLTIQVISRKVFNHSLVWTEELATIMFIWLAYLGTSGAVLKGKHLRIDLFLNMLHGTAKKILLIFTNVVTAFFCCYITIPLIQLVGRYYTSGSTTILLGFPKYLAYAMIPFCLLLTTVRLVQDTVRVTKSDGSDVKVTTAKSIFDDMTEDIDNEEGEK